MTNLEPSFGTDFDKSWVFRTLCQSWTKVLLFFILFLVMAIGFNMTSNYLINGGSQKSKPLVQVKAAMVINPELLALHDYLDLNYYNFAWFVSASEKEEEKILEKTGELLGRAVSKAELEEIDIQIGADTEAGIISLTWRGRDLALVKANLNAYVSILQVHLKNHTIQRIRKFLQLPPSGKPFDTVFRQYSNAALPSIIAGSIQVVVIDMKNRNIESAAILPGAGYSGSFGFWVVLVLSCLYAAMLSALAWAWFSGLHKQKKKHEEHS